MNVFEKMLHDMAEQERNRVIQGETIEDTGDWKPDREKLVPPSAPEYQEARKLMSVDWLASHFPGELAHLALEVHVRGIDEVKRNLKNELWEYVIEDDWGNAERITAKLGALEVMEEKDNEWPEWVVKWADNLEDGWAKVARRRIRKNGRRMIMT